MELAEQTDKVPEKKIPVVEMFGPTIQGEGLVLGMPTHFIRFGLCDYKCKMCDSLHAVLPELVRVNAEWLTQDEIFDMVVQKLSPHVKMITLSGGNPAIHDLTYLVSRLQQEGRQIALETQASYWNDWIPECDYITLSPKGPGIGERFDENLFRQIVSEIFNQRVKRYPRRSPVEGLSIKVPIFNSSVDLEFLKWVCQNTPESVPVYASLGNPYPPKETQNPDFGAKDEFPGLVEWKMGLLQQYAILTEDLLQDPYLAGRIRFTPQWHVMVWGNERGR